MAKKRNIGVSEQTMTLVRKFLESHAADDAVMVAWQEIEAINSQIQDLLDSKSKLRTLFLKAMRKIPSSERTRPSSKKSSSALATAADVAKMAKKEGEKAFVHMARSRLLHKQSSVLRSARQSPPPPEPSSTTPSAEPEEKMNENQTKEPNPAPETRGQYLARLALEDLAELAKDELFEPDATHLANEFPSLKEEVAALAATFDARRGDYRSLRKAALTQDAHPPEGGFQVVPKATLFASRPGLVCSESKTLTIPGGRPTPGFRQSFEESKRFDVTLQVRDITVRREILYHPETGERLAALQNLGPRGMSLTYNAIATIVLLSIEYLMPLHRISSLLRTDEKSFSRSHLWDVLCYAAEAGVAPYLAMVTNLANNGCRFFGDDCATRTRKMSNENTGEASESNPPAGPSDTEIASQKERTRRFDEKTMARIHAILRREALDANGKPKRGAFTTIVAGQAIDWKKAPWDKESWVIFYFTHFGSFGDTLEDLLRIRRDTYKKEKREDDPDHNIDVTCDASGANRPKDNFGFALHFNGCAMHARRKFFEIADNERTPEVNLILELFGFLYAIEDWLSARGRTIDRVGRMRYRWALWAWGRIYLTCSSILKMEPPNSLAAKAAKYIHNHYEELLNYVDSFNSLPDNGLSERLLRPLRLEENATHGLETERGRLVHDVLRSLLATCRAIGVPFEKYLPWLLCETEKGERKDEDLTPHAYLRQTDGSQPRGSRCTS